MPINAFGITSKNSENKIDTRFFVQKLYLGTNYTVIIEEDIDFKNQFRKKITRVYQYQRRRFENWRWW